MPLLLLPRPAGKGVDPSLTSSSAQERGPSTSPGKHSRADLTDWSAFEPAKNTSLGDLTLTLFCHMVVCAGERCPTFRTPHRLCQVEELSR